MRKSGILLPVSSIPSQYGIGTFSKEAYVYIDFLHKAGQKLWQILPLGPTGYGDSPYQSFSTFAGNPYYIDLEALVKIGWLTAKECETYDFGQNEQYVDYEKIYFSRFKVLRKAFNRASEKHFEQEKAFQNFIESNTFWLEDYALYMAIKNSFGGNSWAEWDEEIKLRKPDAMEAYKQKYAEDVDFYKFLQYLFFTQWIALKAYANKNEIEIVGDIPIYVAFDSADTWANPELFQLDDTCTPIAVAGCPPDAFSDTGQLWGNPLYDWDYHKTTDFAWWMKRIAYCFQLYDVVRIDHFRGFDEYWSVPYGNPTAEKGKWCKGPGYAIFDTMKKTLGERKVIAEDLGYLTDSVIELVKKAGYPGMKILQFAFDSREESDYLPHNYTRNCVVYTGTHDNDTTLGWYTNLAKADRNFADRYMYLRDDEAEVEWEFIRAAISSVADTAIIPMQDYLGLDETARINIPSTLGNNWKWRMKKNACTDELAERIKKLSKLYGRE
ncbi:MAG TPA: 4-alpha-glucanotransferase [Lachnospiraceae bacterium]|nr:4-alpha-glucanotransferase [Lachnospiraceae bacterium]